MYFDGLNMNISSSKLFLYTVASLLSQHAFSLDTPADIVNRENDRIQQQLQERQKYQQQQLLQSSKPPARIEVAEPENKTDQKGPCLKITKVQVLGNHHISDQKINKVAQTYENQCLDISMIETLMGKITTLYLNKGYVTTRVYLPEQDLKTGKLILQIQEGKLSDLKLTKRAQGTISLHTAAPFLKNKILNLRDLEQAIDQINRLQSNNTKMEILPGEKAGESIVVFDNTVGNRLHGYFSYDNKGQDTTGQNQAALGVSLDNPLGLNDLLSLSYNRSLPFEVNRTDSVSGSLIYLLPLGYNTLNLIASKSEYDSILQTQFNRLHSSGDTTSYSGRLERLIYRGLNNQFRANIGITTKDTNAYLESIKLGVSSRKLTILDVGTNYSEIFLSGLLNLNLGYSRGLKHFGALEDEKGLPDTAPKAQFEKMNYGISYLRGFNLWGQNFSFSTSFSGQQAFDTLYGSEQYLIGSLYNVRGFNQNTISGDSGYSFKNDLNLNKVYDFNGTKIIAKHTLGLDYGRVFNKENPSNVGELSGLSLGTSLNISNLSLDLVATQPIHKPNYIKKQGAELFFSTTVSF
ncbi:ShlB/FhaC/HecB family hemolysin secretion/activation protein [Acinetobacter guerrae]|uniref:ShlB/FhaC/HecB family hemolysin secretion/activation protein n=2 Tax=Acinetobacter guerrae TaxID=1843371 RepID=A0A3A8EP77_9GAMM|nr:ShlB/FhaC/HecB family hemolysin secretion/activation protein [Acinetobacter guerrae]